MCVCVCVCVCMYVCLYVCVYMYGLREHADRVYRVGMMLAACASDTVAICMGWRAPVADAEQSPRLSKPRSRSQDRCPAREDYPKATDRSPQSHRALSARFECRYVALRQRRLFVCSFAHAGSSCHDTTEAQACPGASSKERNECGRWRACVHGVVAHGMA